MNHFPAMLILVLALSSPTIAAAQNYHVAKAIPIGAPDHWDYVVEDPSSDRVYIAHGGNVTVIDGRSDQLIGTIAVGGATHGIATVPALGKGYTDDGRSGTVAVFDLATLKVLNRIKALPDADGIVYDPVSQRILVITGDSGKVLVIDPKTDAVISTIDGGGPLEFGVLGGNDKFYVDGEDRNEIVRMDLASAKSDAHWPLTGCKTPHGLAIDRAQMFLFVSCGNKIMDVVDGRDGRLLATLPIGDGTDFSLFDAKRRLAFSSNRDGTLSVIAERPAGKFAVLPPVPTMRGARTMALDPKTGRLFLVASDVTTDNTMSSSGSSHYVVKPGTAKLLILEPSH